MKSTTATPRANIHLRVRRWDRDLIDQAAAMVGADRSQFMIASAVQAAKNILLDQSAFHFDAQAFQRIMEWMDSPATPSEAAGMQRFKLADVPWRRERC